MNSVEPTLRARYLVPFFGFCVIVAFLVVGLGRDPGKVPSPFIGKPAPDFDLPELAQPGQRITRSEMLGQVWLFNVWASWCAACVDEHPLLLDFAARDIAPVIGLNYKDGRDDALAWLARLDNPYTRIAFDEAGDTGIDYGVYGVPETFVIDREGIVRLKHIGPVTRKDMDDVIIPLVRSL